MKLFFADIGVDGHDLKTEKIVKIDEGVQTRGAALEVDLRGTQALLG